MIKTSKTTFALMFGTRDVFPASLIAGARKEMAKLLKNLGYGVLMIDENATKYGAVQSPAQGKVFANFLYENKGKYDGVIVVLPNFGDENGGVVALEKVDVPVMVLAYSDEMDKMGPATRRDSYCGKFSMLDVFCQYGIKFTTLKPHTVMPGSEACNANIDYFAKVCRVVKGVRGMKIGAVGARVTPFKTVRIDEIALQKHGITVETYDLSYVFKKMKELDDKAIKKKLKTLTSLADFCPTPPQAQENIARMGIVLDQLAEEEGLDAIALRCWFEIQDQWNISPCVLMGEMNNRGLISSCEVDIGNAIMMSALQNATSSPAAVLDWNNNYEDEDDKCILFHCGPVPMDMMIGKGTVTDHSMIALAVGEGKSYGPNQGRIKPGKFTFGSLLTKDGKLKAYLGEGEFTKDAIPEDFFGCAGVAHIEKLQDLLLHVCKNGHRHHVSVSMGHVIEPIAEALQNYLGFDIAIPQKQI